MKKNYSRVLLLSIVFLTCQVGYCQSVGINNPQPDPSAILDIESAEKGVLIPRLSLIERDAIPNPAQGLLVFITNDTSFHYFTGREWLSLNTPIITGPNGVIYQAGSGIAINGTQIVNAGDDDPTDDVLIGSPAQGDLGNVFPDPQVIGIQGRPVENIDPAEGQVLKWDGNQWSPANDNAGDASYEAGEGIAIDGTQIQNIGDTDATDDITVGTAAGGDLAANFPDPQVAGIQGRPVEDADPAVGQILKWDGNQWSPANDNAGDASYEAGEGIAIDGTQIQNIGDTDATDDITVGTAAGGDLAANFPDPQVAGIQGRPVEDADPAVGQILKWDGNQWSPANDNAGDASYEAGEGIAINGNQIQNIGDTDATDDITVGTAAGGDLAANFPDPQVAGIQGRPVEDADPAVGQILKWDGNQWSPANDNAGDASYEAGEGIAIDGTQIQNIGDTDATDDITVGTAAGGDLAANFPDPQVAGIQGRPVEDADPAVGQILKWDGNQWSPADDDAGDASYEAGEGIAINGNQIQNIGDTDATDDITVGTAAGGDLAANFPDPQVAGIQGRPVEDADPAVGQILKWDGNQWSPADDDAGDASYDAGEGIDITGTTVTNTSPDIPITLLGQGATTVSGAYPDFVISSVDSVNDADSDPNNEFQTLSIVEDTLELSDGNRITLPKSSLWKETSTGIFYDEGNVGIMVDTPRTNLHIGAEKNVLFGDSVSGSGFKFIYYGQKGALRVGYLNNPFGGYNYDRFWDYDSVGYYSFAAGQNARAKGFGSFAFGSFGWADGSGSVAFFGNARGNNSFTFGGSSKGRGSITFEGTADEEGGIAMYGYTGGRYGVSIGGGTTGLGASSSREDYAIAIGWNSDARGQASIALGPSDAYGYNSFSTGWVTEARGNYSSTFGYQTNSYPYASMALGRFNIIEGDSATWRGGDPIFIIGDGTSNTNRSNVFKIQKNGQTVIGYDDPVGMLQVSSALGSLNNNGALDVTNSTLLLGTETNGIAFDANQIETIADELHLNFSSTQDIRMVEGGGDVGIGLGPAARLDIKQSSNTNTGGIRLRSAANNNTFWDQYFNGTTNDLTFAFNGNNVAAIDAATGAYVLLSDRRVKKDIQELDRVLDKVVKLRPVHYRYTHQEKAEMPSLGFIAQEVEALFPELVKKNGEYKALSYAEFSVIAISAIQEQQQRITELTEQNEALKKGQDLRFGQLAQQLHALQNQVSLLSNSAQNTER